MRGGPTGRRLRWQALQVLFAIVAVFAAGLVSAGVVSGAGPLAVLSTSTDTSTDSTETSTTEPTTGTGSTTDSTDTENTATTETDTSETDTTETTETSPAGTPSIATGKQDYVPTEYVDLYGAGWQPGETVELLVDDREGRSWTHTAAVTADELGDFFYEFRLPEHFVATYSVVATGHISGQAEWIFSDSIAQGASSSNSNSGLGTNGQRLTLSVPTIPAGGVAIAQVVIHKDFNARVICPPAGWTSIERTNRSAGAYVQETFVKTSASASASQEWVFRDSCPTGTARPFGASGGVVVFTGVDTGNPVRAVAEADGSSSGNPTAPSALAVIGDQVVRLFGHEKDAPLTQSSGTEIWDLGSTNQFSRRAAAYTHAHSSGVTTGPFSVTTANSGEWTAQTIVLRMAAPANAPPLAIDDTYTRNEDTNLVVDAVAAGPNESPVDNDTDANGDVLTVTAVSNATGGTATLAAGTITFTPTPNLCGAGAGGFDYTVSDGQGGNDTGRVTVNLTCVDDAGTAVNDAATVAEDSGANTINVLANDTDPDGGSSVQSVTQPAHGTVVNNTTNVSYTPNANYCNGGSPTDNFTYTLNGGSTATVAVTVTCVNDPPVIAFTSGDTTVNEGVSATYTFSVTDPDSSSFTFATDYPTCGTNGDVAGTPTVAASGGSFQCSFPDGPESSTVAVRITDGADASNLITRPVTIANRPPVISGVEAESPIDEGESSTVTVSASDPAGANDPLSYEFDCDGNDVYEVGPQASNSHACAFSDNGTFTVKVRVSDGDGGSDTGSDTVQVDNVPPAVTAPANQTASEGTSKLFDLGSFTDPGDDDPWRVTVAWGDGSSPTVFNEAAPGAIADQAHTYADDGTYTVTITVDEDAGAGAAGSATFQVTVANVAPNVTAPADQTGSEGTSATYTLGSFTDPGDDDPWRVTVDWGDSSTDTVFTEAAPGPIAGKPHTYADDGTYTVTITVDEDNGAGAAGSATFKVTVANVAPNVTAPADQTANEGTAKTFDLGSFTDPGADSPWRVTVTWGDGSPATTFTEASPGAIADQAHTYADNGTYTATITVTEENGTGPGSDTATFDVVIANANPVVAKPTFQPVLIACQTMTTLTGISFSDAGENDRPWTVDIDWGDGSPHTTYATITQGAQPNQTHTYSTPGAHTATVTVTDKDGGSGSNTSTADVTVFQYSVDFRPPVDQSTATATVVNKMKNGRVVPVKVRIRDLCAGADLTDPNAQVTIRVTKSSGASGTGDPVEEYADAGSSSGGTNAFRWGGDHWIYNLDSKALGLVIGNRYRVDVYVNGAKATVITWAVLEPVK